MIWADSSGSPSQTSWSAAPGTPSTHAGRGCGCPCCCPYCRCGGAAAIVVISGRHPKEKSNGSHSLPTTAPAGALARRMWSVCTGRLVDWMLLSIVRLYRASSLWVHWARDLQGEVRSEGSCCSCCGRQSNQDALNGRSAPTNRRCQSIIRSKIGSWSSIPPFHKAASHGEARAGIQQSIGLARF